MSSVYQCFLFMNGMRMPLLKYAMSLHYDDGARRLDLSSESKSARRSTRQRGQWQLYLFRKFAS